MTDRTIDPILVRAQEVAENEIAPYMVLNMTRENVLAIARAAYLQGRVDVRLEVVDRLRAARAEFELECA